MSIRQPSSTAELSVRQKTNINSLWGKTVNQSIRKTSILLLCAVVSWATFSLIYFTTIIERRSLAVASSSNLRLPAPRDPFKAPQGHESMIVGITTHTKTVEEESDDMSSDGQSLNSLEPITSTDDSEEDPKEDSITQSSSGDDEQEDVPEGHIESNDAADEHENESQSSLQNIHENIEQVEDLVMNAAQHADENEKPFAIEKSVLSDSVQQAEETCDLLPLNGGRYFWRNRQRLVDLDKTQICGPKILIIGAKRCGTTTIADILLRHPRMRFNSCDLKNTMGGCIVGWFQGALKQGKIFDGDDFTHVRRRMSNGWLDEFGKRLPSTDGITTLTFDKSPSYMDISFFPEVVEYAKAHLPNAKIVATLCNPAERLYSEFHSLLADPYEGYKQLYWDNGVEPPTDFGAFVQLFHNEQICSEKEGFCDTNRKQYLKQGDFLHNLRPWYDTYGKDNVLVVNMDDEPSKIVKKLLHHVGEDLLPESEYPWADVAEPSTTNVNPTYEGRVSSYQYFDDQMKWLEHYYSTQNEELAMFLDEDWPRKWNCRINGDCGRFSW
ncbi:sulfotransferase family protein [Nitzschia inconspicua]|uniref:Sulfotransferase family protein n=1 Tax=Nitzschia inconspicua TaxID=303405 RepID=A0A9K3LWD8_9STRA|nr:sulfotransferase family protein [Nitzschia inconspicua]